MGQQTQSALIFFLIQPGCARQSLLWARWWFLLRPPTNCITTFTICLTFLVLVGISFSQQQEREPKWRGACCWKKGMSKALMLYWLHSPSCRKYAIRWHWRSTGTWHRSFNLEDSLDCAPTGRVHWRHSKYFRNEYEYDGILTRKDNTSSPGYERVADDMAWQRNLCAADSICQEFCRNLVHQKIKNLRWLRDFKSDPCPFPIPSNGRNLRY